MYAKAFKTKGEDHYAMVVDTLWNSYFRRLVDPELRWKFKDPLDENERYDVPLDWVTYKSKRVKGEDGVWIREGSKPTKKVRMTYEQLNKFASKESSKPYSHWDSSMIPWCKTNIRGLLDNVTVGGLWGKFSAVNAIGARDSCQMIFQTYAIMEFWNQYIVNVDIEPDPKWCFEVFQAYLLTSRLGCVGGDKVQDYNHYFKWHNSMEEYKDSDHLLPIYKDLDWSFSRDWENVSFGITH
jgi:hypothetical protein